MPQAKYFSADIKPSGAPNNTYRPFDLNRIGVEGRWAKFTAALARKAYGPFYAFSRRFKPVLAMGGLVHISRDAQVRDVLSRPDDFPVPFTKEMAELGDGATFLLGLDGAEHARLHSILRQVILPRDAEMMRSVSAEFTSSLLDNHRGEVDIINDVIKRVPAEICIRYFGLDCQDADALADWTLSISALLFGDPFGDPEVRALALQGRDKLAAFIDDAITRTRQHVLKPDDTIDQADTLVHRLLIAQRDGAELSDKDIRAMLIGTASGFIPTNAIAASNMLMELLDRPKAGAAARAAAQSDDQAAMRKILLEAGRLRPTLAPGQFRICPNGASLDVDGKSHTIAPGSTLLVSTVSAMRDARVWEDPGAFRTDRETAAGNWQEPDLLFGYGPHVCIGKELAISQISGVMTELFKRHGVRPAKGTAGTVKFVGIFPRNWMLTYDTPSAEQSMYLIIAPVTDSIKQACLVKEIEAWGRPASPKIQSALNSTDVVHFASIAPIESERGLDIIIELNCDGSKEASIKAICEAIGCELGCLLSHTDYNEGDSLEQFLLSKVVELHGKPWGATGLNYNGLAEFPVSKVARDAEFSDFLGRVVRDFVATETSRGSHPMLALGHMRRILRRDPVMQATGTPAQIALMEEAQQKAFDGYSLTTSAMRLALSKYEDPGSHGQAAMNFARSQDGLVATVPLAIIAVLCTIIAWSTLGGTIAAKIVLTPIVALIATALIVAALVTLFLLAVRRTEQRDTSFEARASLDKMYDILRSEDLPGYAQNHVFATAMLKPGMFRTFLHAFGLWAAKMAVTHRFRPGMINGMGTIHYARWYKIPGTRRAVFYSNFDGSWESYLEDFIARVSWGQSAAWSNWEGFPETEFLFLKGAQDSDQFKNYTRTVMRVSPFWYSRFPELSSEQIRKNGMIHLGAGLAQTSTEAEEWLRCFGSRPRQDNLVEQDEVQALVFRGMKRLPYSACLSVILPPPGQSLGEWLCWVRGRPMQIDGLLGPGSEGQIEALIKEGVLDRVPRPDGRPDEYALSHALSITFGDRPLMGQRETHDGAAGAAMSQAAFIGIAAAGMKKFRAPNTDAGTIDEGMPFAFRMGMGGRGEILGDAKTKNRDWWWDDNILREEQTPKERKERATSKADYLPTEAVLMLYAADQSALDRMIIIHEALLTNHGGIKQTQLDCAPAWPDENRIDFEHFGFRDGISQPAMRGVGRSTRGLPERDIMEPGEFIIGYKNNSGYMPMSPTLPPEADVGGALPVVVDDNLSRFPDFGDSSLTDAQRDLGRNGTFIVLRELKQDVDGFHAFAEGAAKQLNQGGYSDLYKVIGQRPDADWVKAKMMGRWQDGRPLIGNPVNNDPQASRDPAERENDFTYGEDDPQGLACPFASHIRRTNPRDSKNPIDPMEQTISNRHRLLRRGRPYVRKLEDGSEEKGLLFASIGTDIERQFEFVQQFWANAPAFHGLDNEPDPVIGSDVSIAGGEGVRPRYFSIPTAVGPVRLENLQNFVETKGGGYFFMPSRSALSWLSETALYYTPAGDDASRQQEARP